MKVLYCGSNNGTSKSRKNGLIKMGYDVSNFELEKNVAGIYGRQEPMEFSRDSDKRDLFLVFGLDRKIQIKDLKEDSQML